MSAFLFTLGLFAFWAVLGYAVITVFSPRLRILQGILISPAVGIAVSVLVVFFINRAGIPVKDFGWWLVLSLAVLSIVVLVIKRPIFPFKKLFPFIAVLFAALILNAWPMLSYGFNWASFANDDMANYALAAQRFLNHGFFEQPNFDDLLAGKDYSLAYWFMHVRGNVRSGSELMLAVVWAFTGLNAHQIFMPVIMALHLALLAVTGAMVSGWGYSRRVALIAISLMAISPMSSFGAIYQLIGQEGGLVLLGAAVTLMCRPYSLTPVISRILGLVPAVLVFSGLFVWYPELLPFLGMGWILYTCLLLRRSKDKAVKVLVPALAIGVVVLLVLNKYLLTALTFMFVQATGGMTSNDPSGFLFPYFMTPNGIAAFWGLIPVSGIHEPFLSIAIVGGLLLAYWVVGRIIPVQIKRGTIPASFTLIMMVLGIILFFRNNDFGLFKLVMYIQPFLVGVVAIALAKWNLREASRLVILFSVAVFISMLGSNSYYISKSTGENSLGRLVEIPNISKQKVYQQLQTLFDSLPSSGDGYISSIDNIILAKFMALYSQGKSVIFPSRDYFDLIINTKTKDIIGKEETEYKDGRLREYKIETNSKVNKFFMPAVNEELISRPLITAAEKQNIFNGRDSTNGQDYFELITFPKNYLIFLHSDLGYHYYLAPERKKIAFYTLENDPMFPGQQFSALGQDLLFLAIRPTKKPRIMMELTSTLTKQFDSELPKPQVQNVPIGFIGRGSGRIFSDPIELTDIDGMSFVSVDMGRKGKQMSDSRNGLMLLYGRDVLLDSRYITTFGRNISLISEELYQSLQPPQSIAHFPTDLADPNLEYSGIYEDGWISERSFFKFKVGKETDKFIICGMIPQLGKAADFSTELKIRINGQLVSQQKLGVGAFSVEVPVTGLNGSPRVDLEFTNYQQLPGDDGRITAGKIDFIGFN
ncbi:TPA: hypothetical protein PXJ53_001189 [Yersinia enterocolitica]|uniref:hypothetical protein n=1 Tax=Yersinia enterocolitica TaxID=630 RepID=UPI0005E7CDBD|nr:hypothetical protein [Yersinia enterocolitica]EKN4822989.1 hypothetical protein [Yersinia enterocolitica]EKN6002889.1 hypothetical protein [Yersinia enterocolitica]EKN6041599.1 hypothetical protein [Yersinia enterocolitica]EKN6347700.1 hypothetical protein [Yersinia enterocolitica]EKN6393034.1 hypothetical protein [Yersinia enterocolitica]